MRFLPKIRCFRSKCDVLSENMDISLRIRCFSPEYEFFRRNMTFSLRIRFFSPEYDVLSENMDFSLRFHVFRLVSATFTCFPFLLPVARSSSDDLALDLCQKLFRVVGRKIVDIYAAKLVDGRFVCDGKQ